MKNELRVSSVFKKAPLELLNMIVVHELAHLKEKQHDKAFYKLCIHMLPDYHQLEFDMRLYMIQTEIAGIYWIYSTLSGAERLQLHVMCRLSVRVEYSL